MADNTLKDVAQLALDILKDNAASIGVPADNIYWGKHGEMPTLTPFLMVYAEPLGGDATQTSLLANPVANIMIFAGAGIDDTATANINADFDAVFTAIAYAERACRLLISEDDFRVHTPPQFDNNYGGYYVSYCELTISYEFNALL
ncbi:MAG: hypothetical protein JNL32_02995 [Candidatus Kapabacteria bacterium]|nr:hypothetical protein [Candidatus Kapabacteria bacterium]